VEQIDTLVRVLEKEDLPLMPDMLRRFSEYRNLILEWNQKVNLISRNDESRIITRHFLQSMGLIRIVDFPKRSRVLDLGSGAGFPGVPLKLIRPDLNVILVDSIRKKARFLNEVIRRLELKEIEARWIRVEDIADIDPVDWVVSRSVATLERQMRWCRSVLRYPGGWLVAIKGKETKEEVDRIRRKSAALGVGRILVKLYNPFPGQFVLTDSYVVMVERAAEASGSARS
jgi:16S rRNA (guanine527-N7)-methyltransferase